MTNVEHRVRHSCSERKSEKYWEESAHEEGPATLETVTNGNCSKFWTLAGSRSHATEKLNGGGKWLITESKTAKTDALSTFWFTTRDFKSIEKNMKIIFKG